MAIQISRGLISLLEREQLSQEDFNVITALLRSIGQSMNHDKTASFIKENIENEISCRTCRLDESANFVTDGDFHIWAGKVGVDQTIVSERVALIPPPRTTH